MKPQQPDSKDEELIERYQRASAGDSALPSDSTRESILAEGRRMAQQFAKSQPLQGIDTGQSAANQPRWRLAAFGSVGVALFAAVLMLPYLREPPRPTVSQIAANTGPAAPHAASASSPAPALAPQEADTDRQSLQESVVTGERKPRSAPPLPRSAGKLAKNEAPAGQPPESLDAAQRAAAPEPAQTPIMPAPLAGRPAPQDAPMANLAGSSAKVAPEAFSRRSQQHLDALLPSALPTAVVNGDLAQVQAVLDQGADIRGTDSAGRSALFLAVMQGRADMVRLLLARGADPNLADGSGGTPLQRAQQDKRADIAALLTGAGARQ